MKTIPVGESACRSIPSVRGVVPGDWATAERMVTGGLRLDFGQPWFERPEAELKPGRVWLGVQGEDLLVYAALEDDQPANRATRWNEPTWTTGDVIEFFFQAEGRENYHEFHVTPENQRLQLSFPEREVYRKSPLRFAVGESRFESATRIHADRTGWEVMMSVKLARLLERESANEADAKGARFRYSFSRYDYQPGRVRPVTSATPRLSAPDFHNIDEWDWARIG